MNKGIIYVLISLMLMTGAMAGPCDNCGLDEVCWSDYGLGSDICSAYGDDAYLITKWLPGDGAVTVAGITVTPVDANNADWSSTNAELVAVLVHAGDGQCVLEDTPVGSSGTATDVNHGLSFVAFCGYDNGGGCTGCCPGDPYYPTCTPPVPEFSLITLGLAVLGAGLGLALLRKH